MNIQFQNQVNFKARYPFVSQQQSAVIAEKLTSEGIAYKTVGSEIVTGKALVNHVKTQVKEIKNSLEPYDFENGLKNKISEFMRQKKKAHNL